jgi:protein SCO1/2
VAALLAALAIPAALLLTRGSDGPDFRGSTPPAAIRLPVFALEDDQGREVRSRELRGKAVAVTFLDSRCTDACPIIAAQIGQAVRTLGKERADFEALAITTDPVRDTPAAIDTFLRRFRAKGQLRYLDGTVGKLRPLWSAFSVVAAYDTGQANMHSAPVRIYDGNGRWRSTLNAGVDLTPANLVHDLREARDAS